MEIVTARLALRRPAPSDLDAIFEIHSNPECCRHNPSDLLTDREDAKRLFLRWDDHWRRHSFGYWVAAARDPGSATGAGPGAMGAEPGPGGAGPGATGAGPGATGAGPGAADAGLGAADAGLGAADAGLGAADAGLGAMGAGPGATVGFCGLKFVRFREREVLNLFYRLDPAYWGIGLATEAADAVVKWAGEHLPEWPILARVRPENVPSQKVAVRAGLSRADHLDGPGEDGPDWMYTIRWPTVDG
ncbi:GNAT family N-acetyltransferase [Nucisporomicrobium flavum]|uniref:GNAT family N-acetyltransferase n=1 Tax=Nucisporomicrobium flavum TaxID=2785915 RepID=UPI003C300133